MLRYKLMAYQLHPNERQNEMDFRLGCLRHGEKRTASFWD